MLFVVTLVCVGFVVPSTLRTLADGVAAMKGLSSTFENGRTRQRGSTGKSLQSAVKHLVSFGQKCLNLGAERAISIRVLSGPLVYDGKTPQQRCCSTFTVQPISVSLNKQWAHEIVVSTGVVR